MNGKDLFGSDSSTWLSNSVAVLAGACVLFSLASAARGAEHVGPPKSLAISERFVASQSEQLSVLLPNTGGDEKLAVDFQRLSSSHRVSVFCLAYPICALNSAAAVIEASKPEPEEIHSVFQKLVRVLDRYPAETFIKGGPRRVIICSALIQNGADESGFANTLSDTVYLNADFCESAVIHHEFFHVLAAHGAAPDAHKWESLNSADFRYRSIHWDQASTASRHPHGFASSYAMTALGEDTAETFSCMMSPSEQARPLTSDDLALRSKMEAVRKALHRFDSHFDDAFWRRAPSAASISNERVPIKITDGGSYSGSNDAIEVLFDFLPVDLDREISAYGRYLAKHRKSAVAFAARGDALYRSRHWPSAVSDYEKAISIDPELAAGYRGRGAYNYRKGRQDFALSDISMAVRLDPKDASSYIVRGCIQSITSNDRAAIADFTKAIQLNPMISAAYVDRAMVREKLGFTTLAIADLSEAIRLRAENDGELYQRRSGLYKKMGDELNAKQDSERAKILLDRRSSGE